VRAHGGGITAVNRPEGGAEFRIELPCEQTPPTIDADAYGI
jgi:signal transduction histidine kinase